jgi:hypothetical protein
MPRRKFIAILLFVCLAAPALAGCFGSKPKYDDNGELIIPERIQTVMERAADNAKSGGSSLNGKFANWYRDMIASGLEHNYPRYDEQLALLEEMRVRARARNAYLLCDYSAADGTCRTGLYASKGTPPPQGTEREATHAIREAFEGRGTVEMFAWEYEENDPVWSAFMPVYDENAKIIAVLGLDCVATPVLDFPEWNRDSRRWNGLTQ